MGWGPQSTGGGQPKSDDPRRGGGRKILDVSRRGGAKFWTSPEGGAKNFRLDQFFSMFLKHNFFMFWGYFGHFSFFGPRGGKKF